MSSYRFESAAGDDATIVWHAWPAPARARALVLIAHGAAEHGRRYARFAAALNGAGFSAFAIDHRGHGETGRAGRLGVFADRDGWNAAVADLNQWRTLLQSAHPDVPVILFGHSMGSLMAQQYIAGYGDGLAGVVLSGSTLIDGFADLAPLLQAEAESSGRDAPSALMAAQMGGGFNAGIENPETPYDWLSRDRAEVQAYIDDPLCGFDLSSGAWLDLIAANCIPRDAQGFSRVPADLRLCLLAGDADPINQGLAALHALKHRYTEAGLRDIAELYYAGGRHEMLNEINREAVTADLLGWLSGVCPAP